MNRSLVSALIIALCLALAASATSRPATPAQAAALAPIQRPSSPGLLPGSAQAPSTPAAAPLAIGAFVQLGQGLNRDVTSAGTDPALAVGSLDPKQPGAAWVTWAEKQGRTQQIFVSKQNGDKFEAVGASLNIHGNVAAQAPSIAFAGPDFTVPWVAWFEPSPSLNERNVFVSRFNAASGLWVPVGQDRGNNEPSLNLHTHLESENPHIVGGATDPTKPPVAWVCWQEESAHNVAGEIFVSRAVSDTQALGGFRWQPVGLNRSGTPEDPEPSVNLDVKSNSADCRLAFAETNNAVPWVVWAEQTPGNPTQILVARAVPDNTPGAGGFKWQFVPNCAPNESSKCALNVNPTKEALQPSMVAGTVIPGQATVPWIAWSEIGTTGKRQIFVDRLDQVTRNTFINVGASLNVDPNRDATSPNIAFVGNVPFVTWTESVGATNRVFVRHLASDPQTGTWVLDTPREGLAVDKGRSTGRVSLAPSSDGRLDLVWREGNPDKEASSIVVCTNAASRSLRTVPGLAALVAGGPC